MTSLMKVESLRGSLLEESGSKEEVQALNCPNRVLRVEFELEALARVPDPRLSRGPSTDEIYQVRKVFETISSQLDAGESLIVFHSLDKRGKLTTSFAVESKDLSRNAQWSTAFEAALTPLAGFFEFSYVENSERRKPVRFVAMIEATAPRLRDSIGFGNVQSIHVGRPLRLPRAELGAQSISPPGLDDVLQAARRFGISVALGVRICRLAISASMSAALGAEERQAVAELSKSDMATRLTPFVEVDSVNLKMEMQARALLDLLTRHFLPGRKARIEIEESDDGKGNEPDDFSAVLLLNEWPMLLPSVEFLHTCGAPVRYRNLVAPPIIKDGITIGSALVDKAEPISVVMDLNQSAYLLGTTGSGKTVLLQNINLQFLRRSRGFAFFDTQGDAISELLESASGFEERIILIDPSEQDFSSMASFNPMALEEGLSLTARLMEIDRIIGENIAIFECLWDMSVNGAGGPGFESQIRNHMLAAFTTENPTLATVEKLLRDGKYRDQVLGSINPSFLGNETTAQVLTFFANISATTGEQHQANWVGYLASKFTKIIDSPSIKNIVCAEKSSVNFKSIMDDGKALLVDLSGVSSLQSRMIAMLVINEIFKTAKSRLTTPRELRRPFTIVADEMHDYVTGDLPALLAQGRKWGLSAILAHQAIGQLTGQGQAGNLLFDSIAANVQNKIIFAVSSQDAARLSIGMPNVEPHVLTTLSKYTAVARFADSPLTPIVLQTSPPDAATLSAEGPKTALAIREANRKFHQLARRKSPASEKVEHASIVQSCPSALIGRIRLRAGGAVDRISKMWASAQKLRVPRQEDQVIGCIPPLLPGYTAWTHNNSLILIVSATREAQTAVVLDGGHGLENLPGARPGESYDIDKGGICGGTAAIVPLLGMSIRRMQAWPELLLLWEHLPVPGLGWMRSPPERTDAPTEDGLYYTVNGSIVFVSGRRDGDGDHRAKVLRGGHGIPNFGGEKPAENYFVHKDGAVSLDPKRATETSAAHVAVVSGMALHVRIALKFPVASDEEVR